MAKVRGSVMAGRIGETAVYLTVEDAELRAGLDRASNRFKRFRRDTEGDAAAITSSVKGLLGPIGIGAGIAGGVAGLGLGALVVDSIKIAAEIESTAASFKVLVGDAETAKELFADIRKFAAQTPLNTRDLSQAAQTLLGFGTAADQVVPTLRVLGDLAQGNSEKLKALAVVYGQVKGAGKLQGQDFLQFVNQGVPLMGELAKVMGVGVTEVKNLMEEGKITFPTLQKAMAGMASEGGRLFNMMNEKAGTLEGLLSSLTDNWESLLGDFGQILVEEFGLKDLVRDLTTLIDKGKGGLDGMRPIIREIADLLKNAAREAWEMAKGLMVGAAQLADTVGKFDARADKWEKRFEFPFRANVGLLQMAGNFFGNGGRINGEQGAAEDKVRNLIKAIDETFARYSGINPGVAGGFNVNDWVSDVLNGFEAITDGFKIELEQLTGDQIKKLRELREEFTPGLGLKRQLDEIQVMRERGGFLKNPKWDDILAGRLKEDDDLRQFAIGKAIKEAIGGDLKADWIDRATGPARRGSAEAAIVGITAHNAGLVSKENRVEAALREANRQRQEEINLLKQLFELWEKRRLPGIF